MTEEVLENKRKILVVTADRAEHGLLIPVMEELQKGYALHDKVIRTAKVRVAKKNEKKD